MKVEAITKVPHIPSNYSDEEVLKHVRHYFPNPGVALETLFKRFEALIDLAQDGEGYKEDFENLTSDWKVPCPECGTVSKVDITDEGEED